MNEFEKAVDYVRKNKTWSENDTKLVFGIMGTQRCSLLSANPQISDEIYDLMEEYGEENELPENWWLEYGDEDDVFFAL